ncbi:unnamed protein product [Parascedosporium putredinis]|uniref:Elongation factor methyltransferase 7 n=1 Tax=Parascedosporium putredinis TaxID=1442378 RepID=A0A9P1MDX7_9PEZI|nr:unnamed protein product [Parascedosporium putredinis]CAI8004575.1 unnamed protein product [Parascedosporium putredinis]
MEDDPSTGGLFADPDGFYPPTPPPRPVSYTLQSGQELRMHLVGQPSLEANHLWNGARAVSKLFESDPSLVAGRTVLELGAGAGLPSLVCGVLGCRRAVLTDYPDVDIVANMQSNVDALEETVEETRGRVKVRGYVWGRTRRRCSRSWRGLDVEAGAGAGEGFDVLVLADLLFRHSEHGNMVKSIKATLKRDKGSVAYVVFTSYRPWLKDKDLAFFDMARGRVRGGEDSGGEAG